MAAAADLTSDVLAGIESLGVPWWGWTALVVMVFWGLLVPREPQEPSALEEAQAGRPG
jgi:hypothetical protein